MPQGVLIEWFDGCYHPRSDVELRAEVSKFADEEFTEYYNNKLNEWAETSGDEAKRPKSRPVTEALVRNVMEALRSLLLVGERDCRDMPAWVGGEHPDWPAADVLPTRNALVHLSSAVEGGADPTCPPTPGLFSGFCVENDYEPDYRPPAAWLAFLDDVFPDDQESIDALQEYLGYCLSSDTKHQKMLMMCGALRSGKGTIDRVSTRVIGSANRVGATLHDLDGNFSLSGWIGKQVAVITEARVSMRTDTAAVASRLLAISGEDEISIDIKYRNPWSGRLGTRVVVIANDVPALVDPSMALVNRFIFLHFKESFLGRENLGLGDKLMAEVPQILNWCIRGLGGLRARVFRPAGVGVGPEGAVPRPQQQGLGVRRRGVPRRGRP